MLTFCRASWRKGELQWVAVCLAHTISHNECCSVMLGSQGGGREGKKAYLSACGVWLSLTLSLFSWIRSIYLVVDVLPNHNSPTPTVLWSLLLLFEYYCVMLMYLQVNYQHKLLEVLGDKREAVFELLAGDKQGETITVPVNTHTIHAE